MSKEIYGVEEVVDEPKSSIEVSRTTKGLYSWKVKVYGENLDKVLADIERMDKLLRKKYEDNLHVDTNES